MSYSPTKAIEVHCWGMRVGAIAPDPARGYYAFEYYPEFASKGIELSPLLLPSHTAGAVVATDLPPATYRRLPAFVADSLPDKFGNSLIDAWMAQNGLSRNEFTVLDRLAYMGSRAMGALEFVPALQDGRATKPTAIAAKEVVEAARKAVALSAGQVMNDSSKALAQLMQIGASAGGAKAKAVVGYRRTDNALISGQFDMPDGFEPYLLKIDTSDRRPYGAIEYAYSLMAKAAGVNMEECALIEINGKAHFATRRFDRLPGGEKVHMQTLCAMAGMDYNLLGTHDYSQLFKVADALELGNDAKDQLFVRMAFNVCMGNNDDHPKNHAFLLRQGSSWELAPAYDLMHACNPMSEWLAQHAMGVNGKNSDITRTNVVAAGEKAHVRNPERLLGRVLDIASAWSEFAKTAGLPPREIDRIGTDINACAKLLG